MEVLALGEHRRADELQRCHAAGSARGYLLARVAAGCGNPLARDAARPDDHGAPDASASHCIGCFSGAGLWLAPSSTPEGHSGGGRGAPSVRRRRGRGQRHARDPVAGTAATEGPAAQGGGGAPGPPAQPEPRGGRGERRHQLATRQGAPCGGGQPQRQPRELRRLGQHRRGAPLSCGLEQRQQQQLGRLERAVGPEADAASAVAAERAI